MLHLEKVNGNNVWDILKLTVSKSQKNFVANNEISIIEAYTAITGNGHAFPFGIYDEDKPVGFLMIGFDVDLIGGNEVLLRFRYRQFQDIPDIITIYFF